MTFIAAGLIGKVHFHLSFSLPYEKKELGGLKEKPVGSTSTASRCVDGIFAHNVADLSAAENVKSGADLAKEEKSLKANSQRKCMWGTVCPLYLYLAIIVRHNLTGHV